MREIDRLVRADMLLERRSGNRRYLRANERHPLFGPSHDLVVRTDGLAYVLRDVLGTSGIEFAWVFGSVAAGEPRADSDVDILIVGAIGLREAVKRLRPAQERLGREINPVVWTREEFERRRSRRDPFLSRVLEGLVLTVVGAECEPESLG